MKILLLICLLTLSSTHVLGNKHEARKVEREARKVEREARKVEREQRKLKIEKRKLRKLRKRAVRRGSR